MKFAIAVFACAVAAAIAAPAQRAVQVKENLLSLSETIDTLEEMRDQVVLSIYSGEAGVRGSRGDLQKVADTLAETLVAGHNELSKTAEEILPAEDDADKKSTIRERISEIRKAITATTAELASIAWEMLKSGVTDRLSAAKERALKHLTDLKNELMNRMREMLIPDDDVPVTYVVDEVLEQLIRNLKQQLSDAFEVVSDWHNLLTEAGREKVAAARNAIVDLGKRLAAALQSWRNKGEVTEKSVVDSKYSVRGFDDELTMFAVAEILIELSAKTEAKVAELSKSIDRNERQALPQMQEMSEELKSACTEIESNLASTAAQTQSLAEIAKLKALLAQKVKVFEERAKNGATFEELSAMNVEIASLRRRILDAIQQHFNQ